MSTYKLIVAYDGTSYCGWQIQPNGVSIQELIQNSLTTILREKVHVIGSGRTDAGVHATGQVAHFKHSTSLNIFKIQHSLNALLPPDIRILSMEPVAEDFHARYSATGKIYHYHLHLGKVQNPFERLYAWHIKDKIDPTLIKMAAKCFVGTHDFSSFANEAHLGSAAKDPIRTLKRLDVIDRPEGLRLEFEADGFLYKMVRNMTGLIVDIGRGKREIKEIASVFEQKDRRASSMAAPPTGLFLVKVFYPEFDQNLKNEQHLPE